jgi:hypothetical protein
VISEDRAVRHPLRRAVAAAAGLLLLAAVAACGTTTPGGGDTAAPAPAALTGRALGSGFVGVSGTGFPVGAPVTVTATTPQGTTTVDLTTDDTGRLGASVAVPDGYRGPLDLKATAGAATGAATVDAGVDEQQEPAADAGARSLGDVACTTTAEVDATPPPGRPGDVVCLTGDFDDRLEITVGGTPAKPLTYSGGGDTRVRGIDVTADNVIVQGFRSEDARNMGARLQGNGITFRDNRIEHPVFGGDDTDGLRFFGDGITILHNTISDVSDGSDCDDEGCGDGPHPDCMQTYWSDSYPTSSHVTIEGNRCEKAAAQCLIGEGPQIPDEGVNGPGESTDWTVYDNYCSTGAAQSMQFKNVKNVTIVDNYFDGDNNKAIALAYASTGAHVGGNRLGERVEKLITFDDDLEEPGYVGPTPDR